MNWFDVDKEGLAKLLERRGKAFALFELISNAWDSKATSVDVQLTPVQGKPLVAVTVEDDDPDGFADLSHAWTLFAESTRKADAEKRGRFNLGEKLALALCVEAEIRTVSGSVTFGPEGRRAGRRKRESGSSFFGTMRMTREELVDVESQLRMLIPPVATTIQVGNGTKLLLLRDQPATLFEATLPTELADPDGVLRRTARKTRVEIHAPVTYDTKGWIYELGVPVVETGDRWSVNVLQKVPLNSDRDNVTPAYLRELRVLVLNAMHDHLSRDDSTSTWVRDAAGHKDAAPQAVRTVMDLRFGDKRVAFDPSDPEANNIAVTQGFTVVHGGSLSAEEWQNVKRDDAIPAAGKVTPSPKPFHQDGEPLKYLEKLEDFMLPVVERFERIGQALLGKVIVIRVAADPEWGFRAAYGDCNLTLNAAALRADFWTSRKDQNALLIDELSHDRVSNHLSSDFHDECCRLGAALAELAITHSGIYCGF